MNSGLSTRTYWLGFAAIVLVQTFICFQGIGDRWTRGHNGFNGSAYHQAARNGLRWGGIFPRQYYTGRLPPSEHDFYTHHPLGMHLHFTASVYLFGDSEASIRLVPAVHGVLVVIALLLLLLRFWGRGRSLVGGAVYTLLPINGIYANMANHSSGFIFWGLVTFYCYLEFHERAVAGDASAPKRPWLRWYVGVYLFFALTALWDWPAYYLALALAFHWFATGLARHVRDGGRFWTLGKPVGLLVPWCMWVLVVFATHFALVYLEIGSSEELMGTVSERQNIAPGRFGQHLAVVPELMFTWFVLAMGAVWLLHRLYLIARGRMHARDLVALSFCIGGAVHYVVFKWSAIVHSYWAWTMLPFFAIASADVVCGAAPWVRDRMAALLKRRFAGVWVGRTAAAVGAAVFLLLVPLVVRSIDLVPRARAVGGSMWFVENNVRPGKDTYSSNRDLLHFATAVKSWTNRHTGVLVHWGFGAERPESRYMISLDREVYGLARQDSLLVGPRRLGIDGWVLTAPVKSLPLQTRVALAARHPYKQYGDYVMVDLREVRRAVEVWTLERESSWWWWFWHDASDGKPVLRQDAAAEQVLSDQIEALLAGKPVRRVRPTPKKPSAQRHRPRATPDPTRQPSAAQRPPLRARPKTRLPMKSQRTTP